jgi:acyl-CoA synthetase (NDP forming)
LGAIFDFDLYGAIEEKSLRRLKPDALLPIHTFSSASEADASRRLAGHLGALSRELEKPLAFCAFAQRAEVEALKREAELPIFTEIELAVRVPAASRDRQMRSRWIRALPPPAVRRSEKVEALLGPHGPLTTDASLDLCAAYDVPVAERAVVEDVESATFAASAMGCPVALKGPESTASHRSDGGLVTLDVADAEELQADFAELLVALEKNAQDAQGSRVMVQPMVSRGREVIIGGKRDPSFGPLVMFGIAGVQVQILDDVAFRLAPLTRERAELIVDQLRGYALLRGGRGEPPADVDAEVGALLSVSKLLMDCLEIVELDVNPLPVFEQGAAAIDARAVVWGQRTLSSQKKMLPNGTRSFI